MSDDELVGVPRRNAGVLVEVYGLGPGRVGVHVTDAGPEPLSWRERAHVLREALAQCEAQAQPDLVAERRRPRG